VALGVGTGRSGGCYAGWARPSVGAPLVRRAVLLEVLDRAPQVLGKKICHVTGEVLLYHHSEDRNVLGVRSQAVGRHYPASLTKVG